MNENLRILIINPKEMLSQKFVKELYARNHANYLCVNINIHQREWINKYIDNWKPDMVVILSDNITKFVIEAVKRVGITLVCKSSEFDKLIKTSIEKFYIVDVQSEYNFGAFICDLIESDKFGSYLLTDAGIVHLD